jgi:carbohydrate kinase (thermoresistant glucokinase family)
VSKIIGAVQSVVRVFISPRKGHGLKRDSHSNFEVAMNMVIILMGPMGCGKTTVGKLLADALGWTFIEGDDYHPSENVEKMAAGIPLTDEDRNPWLVTLRTSMAESLSKGQSCIVACSALKEAYRNILGIDQKSVISIYLRGTRDLLQERLNRRTHRYMNNSLLDSQLETLETPQSGIVVDIDAVPEKIVGTIVEAINKGLD